jgi:oligopeptidase B
MAHMISKPSSSLLALFFFLLGACGPSTAAVREEGRHVGRDDSVARTVPRPPVAKRVPHPLVAHGEERDDPYYWMRDDDRDDPEVLQYLEAENAYAEARLGHVSAFRRALFDEIVGRIVQDDSTVPYFDEGYHYYTRFEEGKEYPIFCRKPGTLDAAEQVMLNANVEAARGEDYYQVGGLDVSKNGRLLAYAEDLVGRRLYTIRFRDLETGQDLPESIPTTSGDLVWARDDRTLFYVKKEEGTLREYQVWRHTLGTDAATDVLVYEETDPEFYLGLSLTKSKKFIVIASYQTLSHEMRIIPADRPTTAPRVFLPREENHEYEIDHIGNRFYVRTNWEARDFRLMSVDERNTANKARWREEIPHRDGQLLEEVELFDDYLVVNERRDGLSRLRVIPWRARSDAHEIAFEEEVFVSGIDVNVDPASHVLRFEYTSLTTPPSIFDYDMQTRERTLMKEERVLGGFDRARYVAARLEATAADGTKIPISLVHRRDLDRTEPQPLLLYGYGSYGYSSDPYFSSPRLSLLDRGFVFAIAHVRGGQEMGRRWYEDGRLMNKKNTFTDFVACAEHLVRERYTTPEKLFAYGASAGGLLMGAIANMRPDLFRAIVADVPFVDVVTTMLDESIPLTTFEYDEWGNPSDRAFYDYMLSYSPYDNVARADYPAMLVLSGLHDSQVQYWEPTKWVAKLRATRSDDDPTLLVTQMAAGHSGPSGRFRRHEENALIFAFFLDQLGIHE